MSGPSAENINTTSADQRLFSGSNDTTQANTVREMKLWYPEQAPERPVLITVMADTTVMMYQNLPCFEEERQERFRFKLVDSHVLIRPRSVLSKRDLNRQFIHIEGKMAIILHPKKAFGAFIRHGKPILVNIGK